MLKAKTFGVKRLGMIALAGAVLLALSACGGFSGDSGEIGKAKSALKAFANGDMEALMDLGTPDSQNAAKLEFEATMQRWSDMDKDKRDGEFKRLNDSMWWDDKYKKVEGTKELATNMTVANYVARELRQYSFRAKEVFEGEKKVAFVDRVKDMEVVGYDRGFSGSNPEWGTAKVVFANKFDESVTVSLVQRGGTWYVTDLSPKGFKLRDKDADKKKD